MAIRIRVYPQYGYRGVDRGRAERDARRHNRLQRAQIRNQQQMLARQQMQSQARAAAFNAQFGYHTGLGYLAGYATPSAIGSWTPGGYASSWTSNTQLPIYGSWGGAAAFGRFGLGAAPLYGASMVNGAYYGC